MSYKIEKIEEETFIEFLMNPYFKAACLEDCLFQKYPENEFLDDVVVIKEGSQRFEVYGRIDYITGEIIVAKHFLKIDTSYPFISVYDIKKDLKEKVRADLEEMKELRAEEIKLTKNYMQLSLEHSEKCLERIVFEMLGAAVPFPYVIDRSEYMISKFVDSISLDDIVKIRACNYGFVEDRIGKIFESDNFILYNFIQKEAKERAIEIISTGALTERQKHLKNIIEKIKDCDASTFAVETISGANIFCKNKIYSEGTIFLTGPAITNYIDFETINKITYNDKIIYQKGVF